MLPVWLCFFFFFSCFDFSGRRCSPPPLPLICLLFYVSSRSWGYPFGGLYIGHWVCRYWGRYLGGPYFFLDRACIPIKPFWWAYACIHGRGDSCFDLFFVLLAFAFLYHTCVCDIGVLFLGSFFFSTLVLGFYSLLALIFEDLPGCVFFCLFLVSRHYALYVYLCLTAVSVSFFFVFISFCSISSSWLSCRFKMLVTFR